MYPNEIRIFKFYASRKEGARIESRIEIKREVPLPKAGEKSQTKIKNLSNSCIIGL